ncbi:hypothetical protein CMI47_20430 [Candidatus Pacearchaeota archaeon]|nr:hypothetical protein [Candidatus Pacearchaeota archaeon]|tara:strand:+ start:251 stop:475 length:225 start_codon:yes stop_codon:yes gene_type:complete
MLNVAYKLGADKAVKEAVSPIHFTMLLDRNIRDLEDRKSWWQRAAEKRFWEKGYKKLLKLPKDHAELETEETAV